MTDPRQQSEEASHLQPEWWRVVLTSIGDAVITTDMNGNVTFLNPVAQALTGWTQEKAAGRPFDGVFRIINEESRQPVESPTVRALQEGVIVGLAAHTLLVTQDGMELPIGDSAAPIRDDKGEITGVVLIFRDITERRRQEQEMQDAIAYADNIIATLRQPFVVLDKGLRVQTANSSFYRTFHVSKEETEGRSVYDLGNSQWDIPGLRKLLEEVLPQNLSFQDYGVEHDFPTIGRKVMLVNARRFVSVDRRPELILLAIEDITERKQAEVVVQTSEVRYRRLFETAKDGILILDAGTLKIIDANPFMTELLGYPYGEFLGKELWEIGLFGDKSASQALYQELQAKGYIRYENLPLETKNGARAEVEFVSNIYHVNHRPIAQCNIRDITDRMRLARAVKTSEVRYRRLFEAARDGILLLDPDTRKITDANPFMVELLGYTHGELVGKELWEIGLFSDEQASREAFHELRETGSIRYEDLPLLSKHGTRREVEFVSNIYQENGHQVIQCNIRDITERKQAEEQLKHADRQKDEFLAMLGHELRNPLAPMRNALQLVRLSDGGPRQEVRQAYDIIERQVENMVRLVDDLLDVARITSGKIQLQKERIELGAVVVRAIEGARPLIDAKRHTLEVILPEESVPVEADPVRLAQVLWNLLNNAAKYTPDGGRIILEVERTNEAVVRIRDSGMGIAPEMLPRVFDLFTQMERTLARAEGGLGLGLTLVRRLTGLHGGTVEVTSAGPGYGSEFVVRLPLLPDEAPAAQFVKPEGAARRVAPASGRRILVVDDNRDSAESLAMLLRLFGNDVRTVSDGILALEVAALHKPDVVLLDIGLPRLDGLEVCRRLRERTGEARPLIVAMTGYGQEEDRRRSEEAGFDAHMVKPVDLDALQELLSRPELARGATER